MKPRYDQDPSYQAFVNRYANDIVAFVEEILQVDVSPLMANALQHYFKPALGPGRG